MKLKNLHRFYYLFSALIRAEINYFLFPLSINFKNLIFPINSSPLKLLNIEGIKIFKSHNGKL